MALGVFAAASSADAAGGTSFRGRTSQGRAISFKLDGGAVTELKYHIDDRCPDGRLLFVRNWGFPALPVKDSQFGGTFIAKPPEKAKAVVAGRVSGKIVSGTLTDRSRNNKTHKFCTGKATFKLTQKRRAQPGSARDRDGRTVAAFARPRRRYYDAVSERTALEAEKHQQIS
jgi:hypothetical protein